MKQKTQARRSPKQARSQLTIEQIQLATLTIIQEEGVHEANTNRIAKQAGVSVSSLYHFYPNKEAIIRGLFERWLNAALENIDFVEAKYLSSLSWQDFFPQIDIALHVSWMSDAAAKSLWESIAIYPDLRGLLKQHDEEVTNRISRYLKYFGSTRPHSERMATAYLLIDIHTASLCRQWQLPSAQAKSIRHLSAKIEWDLLQNSGLH